jgi:hypothetical protein
MPPQHVVYIERFSNRVIPDACTFTNILKRLRDHGTFSPSTQDLRRSRSDRVLEAEPAILEAIDQERNLSIRRLVLRAGVSTFIVYRTLHEQGLHPFHIQRVQLLNLELQLAGWPSVSGFSKKKHEAPNFR